MAVTLSNLKREDAGSQVKVSGTITFDSSYATSGESISASSLGLAWIEDMEIKDSEGYTYDCDVASGGATALVKAYRIGNVNAVTTEAIKLTDSNTAATDGVQIYAHTKDGKTGWLEFVSPTDADGVFSLASGGSNAFIFDSDAAATDGFEVYIDEDATNADDRLQIVSPSNSDIYVPVAGSNKFIKLKDNDTAATDGTNAYFDEDGTNAYDRVTFVSPSNTDAFAATDDEYTPLAPFFSAQSLTEVTSSTDLSSVVVDFECLGK